LACLIAGQNSQGDSLENREQQILRIAGKLFGSVGFDRTSLRLIAEEAGVTKAALYYYFPDKEALYDKVVLDALQRLDDFVDARVSSQDSPQERLHTFIASTAEFMDMDRDSWLAGSNSFWSEQDRARRERAVAARDQFERRLRGIMDELVQRGLWRSLDTKLATRMLLSAINQIPRWHNPEGPLSAVQVAEQYLDMFTRNVEPQ
jgi:AcrR family transcriptional regulator